MGNSEGSMGDKGVEGGGCAYPRWGDIPGMGDQRQDLVLYCVGGRLHKVPQRYDMYTEWRWGGGMVLVRIAVKKEVNLNPNLKGYKICFSSLKC